MQIVTLTSRFKNRKGRISFAELNVTISLFSYVSPKEYKQMQIVTLIAVLYCCMFFIVCPRGTGEQQIVTLIFVPRHDAKTAARRRAQNHANNSPDAPHGYDVQAPGPDVHIMLFRDTKWACAPARA